MFSVLVLNKTLQPARLDFTPDPYRYLRQTAWTRPLNARGLRYSQWLWDGLMLLQHKGWIGNLRVPGIPPAFHALKEKRVRKKVDVGREVYYGFLAACILFTTIGMKQRFL